MIYLKDGNIPLNLAYDDDIVQEANSTYQLSFKFPLTDEKWHLLKREVFLLADDLHGEQEFFIFEVKKAKGHVQVYAKQVATLLNYYSIDSISVDRVPGQTAMTALAGSIKRNCPFTFFSDIMDRHTFNESNVSVMDALAKEKHSIVGQWGGDLVRDKYQVKLLKNGGIENESLFMYKKNLSSYEESENINSLKTRLHLKKTIQGQSEGEEDRVIAVTVDSPLISQYSQIYEADIEVNDQDVTDEASLLAYGQRYFSSTLCDLVENSIHLDVKGKSDVSVKMFDTVSVFHERFDVDLRLKITSYHFGPMSKRLKSIGFGKVSQSFGSAVVGMVASSVDRATGAVVASFEQKLQKEIDNANRHFDAEFDKRVESINDGIEQAKAEAELYADNIKQSIDADINAVNQSMQAQSEEHDRQVAEVLAKAGVAENLATDAKRISDEVKSGLSDKVSLQDFMDAYGGLSNAFDQQYNELNGQLSTKLSRVEVDGYLDAKGYITNSALQNSLRSYPTITEMQNKVTETADSFSRTISETKALIPSGESNLVKWGRPGERSEYANTEITTHSFFYNNGVKMYVVRNTSATNEKFVSFNRFAVERNTDYTLYFKGFNNSATVSMDVWFLKRTRGSSADFDEAQRLVAKRLSGTRAEEVVVTFNTGNFDEGYIRFDNNGSTTEGSSANLYFGDVSVKKGKSNNGWSPSVEELATVTALHNVTDKVDSHTRTIGAVGESGSI
ncbi:TPA: phage tail spike protein, partial [Streptococcus suis]